MICVECDYPLRPRRRNLAEYPGTRENKGRGVCTACFERKRNRQEVRVFDVGLARVALEAYMVERRRRREANGLVA